MRSLIFADCIYIINEKYNNDIENDWNIIILSFQLLILSNPYDVL